MSLPTANCQLQTYHGSAYALRPLSCFTCKTAATLALRHLPVSPKMRGMTRIGRSNSIPACNTAGMHARD